METLFEMEPRTVRPWSAEASSKSLRCIEEVDYDVFSAQLSVVIRLNVGNCRQHLADSIVISFGGDNRGFQVPNQNLSNEPGSRTAVMVVVNWGNPDDQSIRQLKTVGTTHKYLNGRLIDQRTASTNGIKFTESFRRGAYAQTRIKHDVGNPFAASVPFSTTL